MIMPAVSSCIYEYDTCQPERGIIIVNDWELVAKASPKGMAFIFFPEDGSAPWRFDFPGMEGGQYAAGPVQHAEFQRRYL